MNTDPSQPDPMNLLNPPSPWYIGPRPSGYAESGSVTMAWIGGVLIALVVLVAVARVCEEVRDIRRLEKRRRRVRR